MRWPSNKIAATTTTRAGAKVTISEAGEWHCEGCDASEFGGRGRIAEISRQAQQHADTCNFKRA